MCSHTLGDQRHFLLFNVLREVSLATSEYIIYANNRNGNDVRFFYFLFQAGKLCVGDSILFVSGKETITSQRAWQSIKSSNNFKHLSNMLTTTPDAQGGIGFRCVT